MGTFHYTLTDGTKITLPVPALSHSSIGMFLRCPRQFFHRYVEGKKEPPGIAMIQGTAAGAGLELNNRHKMAQGEDLPAEKVIECFADKLATEWRVIPASEQKKEKKDDVIAQGRTVLGFYMKNIAGNVNPTGAEAGFRLDVQGVPIIGYADMLEAKTLWDYKYVGSRSNYLKRGAVDESMQLTMYSRAFAPPGEEVRKYVGYIALVKDKGEARQLLSSRTLEDWRDLEDLVVSVAKAISAGAFPRCDPTNWLCKPQWCGFAKTCRPHAFGSAA